MNYWDRMSHIRIFWSRDCPNFHSKSIQLFANVWSIAVTQECHIVVNWGVPHWL